jgi:hypothetical protein
MKPPIQPAPPSSIFLVSLMLIHSFVFLRAAGSNPVPISRGSRGSRFQLLLLGPTLCPLCALLRPRFCTSHPSSPAAEVLSLVLQRPLGLSANLGSENYETNPRAKRKTPMKSTHLRPVPCFQAQNETKFRPPCRGLLGNRISENDRIPCGGPAGGELKLVFSDGGLTIRSCGSKKHLIREF